jgi:hypothetical protein
MQTVEEKQAYNKIYAIKNKAKIAARTKKYREENREKVSAQRKISRVKDREKNKAYDKIYRKLNYEEISIRTKKYRKANKEKVSAQKKASRLANIGIEKARVATYYQNNKDKIKAQHKLYYKKNKDKIAAYGVANRDKSRVKAKKYYEKHKEKIRTKIKKRMKTDLKFKLNKNMSCLIRHSLKNGNGKNGYHWETLVPYNLNDLIKRLKKTLPKGYRWNDYINGKTDLQIDHKIPVLVHNFKSHTNTDFQRCWALKNLRLLPAFENMSKGAKLKKPFQPSLLL